MKSLRETIAWFKITIANLLALCAPSCLLSQVPNAEFTSNIASGCSPLTVQFTDLSTNTPTAWFWDFGNTNNSTLQNPGAIYIVPGTYTVSLTATNLNGSNTETKFAYITVFQNPSADFTADTTYGCNPLEVQFTDLSVNGSAPVISWFWDLGDGSPPDYSQNPSHIYSGFGSYDVTLVVTDLNGCQSTLSTNNYIKTSDPPIVNFTGTPASSCSIPLTVSFNDFTVQGSEPIAGWQWNFGDVSPPGFSQNPSHIYSNYGSYDVTLVVTDSNSCSDTLILNNYINIQNFNANFTTASAVVCPNMFVFFSDSSFPAPVAWNWNFGNGNVSSAQNPMAVYLTTDTFTVTLIATSSIGCVDTVQKNIVFQKPLAQFTPDSSDNCALPFTVNFSNNSTGNPPLSYFWNFDDGSPIDTNQNPSHTFIAEGIYDVSLVVVDGNGCRDTLAMSELGDSIIVQLPVAFFVHNQISGGCIPLTVNFTDSSTNAVGSIVSWNWNFGDSLSGGNNTSSNQNPTHIFDSAGTYNVSLTITTDRGCTDTFDTVLKAGTPPLLVDFSMSDTIICHGDSVFFNDLSLDTINNWYWSFGDGSYSSVENPVHEFLDTGLLTVTLYAGFNGCDDSISKTIYVLPPKPLFTAAPSIGCSIPHQVTFTDASWGAETWLWNFGDGFTSTDTNAVHTYTQFGSYTVKLEVSNSNGCVDSVFATIAIPDINAYFFAPDTTECFSLPAFFFDTSSYLFTPQLNNWFWDFGDSTTYSSSSQISSHIYSDTGTYNVMLVVTDFYGCKDTLIKQQYISVNGVYANFGADITTGCAPLLVSFFDSTASNSGAVAWQWNFGDGTAVDTLQNPTHLFTDTQIYSIQLVVTDSNGCMDSLTMAAYIQPDAPYPYFTYKPEVCIGEDAAINDSSSGAGISYFWDFGDGFTDTSANPLHAYADTGLYYILLTVSDSNGCDSTLVQTITVTPFSIAGFTVDTLVTNCPPLVVSFIDASSPDVVSWLWNFGDSSTSSTQSPVHTYTYPDTFNLTLIVINSTGCSDTLFVPDLIKVGGPYGSFAFWPDSGCVPLDVTFTASAVSTLQYEWDFGDGNIDSLSGDSVVHTYLSPGTPSPVLILKDSLGCKFKADPPSPDSIIIDQPVALFNVSTTTLLTTLCGLDTVFFVDSSYTQNIYTTLQNWLWDFGDFNTSNQVNPYHVYSDTGSYNVLLSVENSIGCIVYDSILINVMLDTLNKLSINITGSKDVNCFGDNDGEAYSVATAGTVPYTYLWSDTAGQMNDTAYNLPAGMYWILVSDMNGCKDSDSVVIAQPPELIADIVSSANITCNGMANGTATLNSSGGVPPYTYLWDDPDTQTTTTATGLVPDTFVVSVTDSIGCLDTDTIIITEPALLAIANSGTTDVLCNGDSTGQAAAQVSGGTRPYTYSWNTVPIQTDSIADSIPVGNFTVSVIDTMGCSANFIFSINQPSLLSASVTGITAILCYGDSTGEASIKATGGVQPYNYNWSPSGGTDTLAINLVAGTYFYSVTDSNGCVFIDSVVMSQPPQIQIITSGADSICENSSAQVSASAVGGTGMLTYLWNNGLGTGQGPFTVTPDSLTIYQVTVTDGNNCAVTDSASVMVFDLIQTLISGNKVCEDDNVEITATITDGADSNYIYVWDFGQGPPVNSDSIVTSFVYTAAGTYSVSLTVVGSPACVTDSLSINPVVVFSSPHADFTANPLNTTTKGPYVAFTDQSTGGVLPGENIISWFWDFGDGQFADSANPNHFYTDSGNFAVLLVVTNGLGCTDSQIVNITVFPVYEIDIPNAFTPDPSGPNGGIYNPADLSNNVFYPITGFVTEYHLMIFNRWGEMVFESFDLDIGWDGYYRGELSQQDVYVWKIKLKYANGTEFSGMGDLTLIR